MKRLIYLLGPGVYPVGDNATCWFNGKNVTLRVNGKSIRTLEAKSGDAVSVERIGWKYLIYKVGIPENAGGVVAWLLCFNKHNRTPDIGRLHQIEGKECNRCSCNGSNCIKKELCSQSGGYCLVLCSAQNRTGYKCVAGWFSDNITKKEVIELIPLMGFYDDLFVRSVLADKFGITKEEFYEAKQKERPLF